MQESASPPPAPPSPTWRTPWVQLKTFSFHPCLYPAMILRTSPGVESGALVAVYDRSGRPFGSGLWNARARVPLRVLYHGEDAFDEAGLRGLIDRAIDLRLDTLKLPEVTDAFRVVHSDGDNLSGLVIDKFGPLLSVQVHSLGIAQRLNEWLPHIHARLGTTQAVVEVDPAIARFEAGVAAWKKTTETVPLSPVAAADFHRIVPLLDQARAMDNTATRAYNAFIARREAAIRTREETTAEKQARDNEQDRKSTRLNSSH